MPSQEHPRRHACKGGRLPGWCAGAGLLRWRRGRRGQSWYSHDDGAVTESVRAVVDWLVDGARTARRPEDVLAELCARLLACGLPLHRVAVFVRTLHPDVMGRRFLWRAGEGVTVSEAAYDVMETETYRRSPVPVGVRHRRADPPPHRGAGLPGRLRRSSRRCAPRA